MSKYLSKEDYQKLFEFSSKLLTINFDEMKVKILELLDELYGYKVSSFSTFKGRSAENIIGHNVSEDIIKLYKESYVDKDVFNRYMSEFIENIELYQGGKFDEAQTIISINEMNLSPEEFEREEYFEFLKIAGVDYQINLMLNEEDTVVLFRKREEGSIEEKDRIILGYLWNIISNLYRQKKETMMLQKENYFLKKSAEIGECGTFVLNKDFKVLSYNKQALDYGSDITGEDNLKIVIREIVKELVADGENEISSSAYSITRKKYTIRCETENILTKNKYIEKYYLITITKQEKEKNKNKYEKVDKIFNLTKREIEICKWIGQGLSNKDIAEELCISQYTVRTHIENIFRKLEVNNRLAAISKINEILE